MHRADCVLNVKWVQCGKVECFGLDLHGERTVRDVRKRLAVRKPCAAAALQHISCIGVYPGVFFFFLNGQSWQCVPEAELHRLLLTHNGELLQDSSAIPSERAGEAVPASPRRRECVSECSVGS
jgi:hypothetical protein